MVLMILQTLVSQRSRRWPSLVLSTLLLGLAGCTHANKMLMQPVPDPPFIGPMTSTSLKLAELPPPPRALTVAVYDFPDLTGALKPSPNVNVIDYSKAVTQGASSVLVDTLKLVGNGTWFWIAERSRLEHLLRERRLVQDTYAAVKRTPEKIVSPLLFAEYLLEGGIISFDSTVVSGGIGAKYLGVGSNVNYLKNFITVTLRLVNVRTGNVVTSITASKSVYSITGDFSLTKFISVSDDLLDIHAGVTSTEPTQIAVREAIESAVYHLIMHASATGLWDTPPPEMLPPQVLATALRSSLAAESQKSKQKAGGTEQTKNPGSGQP
jgi:curli production assembly/transport component CsgG